MDGAGPDFKLIPRWFVGKRDTHAAYAFMKDLAGRLASQVQLSTDGYNGTRAFWMRSFGSKVDYGQVIEDIIRLVY